MPKVRKIKKTLPNKQKNYYVVDASFLVNKYIPTKIINDIKHKRRIEDCQQWWKEIDKQLRRGRARVYIPSACIAESFKVLAQLAFHPQLKRFKSTQQYNYYRNKLHNQISLQPLKLRSFSRNITYHDIPMDRDIILSIDRFYELFAKYKKRVGVIDLSIATTAKYLMDFFDIPKDNLHIVTLDKSLRGGIQKSQDLPNAYDPTFVSHSIERIFE
ncbi:hypothetical protein ISS37_07550 [candidate division KSB1 bacterium]|nr:hypothetical protein [candidate division KSB1 bacterium]